MWGEGRACISYFLMPPTSILYASLLGGARQINEHTILMFQNNIKIYIYNTAKYKDIYKPNFPTFSKTLNLILVFDCLTEGIISR